MDPDFGKLEEKLIEFEKLNKAFSDKWSCYIEEWNIKRKALHEIKLLYEKLGPKQFMELAETHIQNDILPVNLNYFFGLLDEKDKELNLEKEYYDEVKNLNRNFMAKVMGIAVDNQLTGKVIDFIVYSIGKGNISKEFIDSIRLDPNSTLFTEEYVKNYGQSLKDGGWQKNDYDIKGLVSEANERAEKHINDGKYHDATYPYINMIELKLFNDHKDILFKILLCDFLDHSSFLHKYHLEKHKEFFPNFIDSNQHKCIQNLFKSNGLHFNERNKLKNETVNKYLLENDTDDITRKLLETIIK